MSADSVKSPKKVCALFSRALFGRTIFLSRCNFSSAIDSQQEISKQLGSVMGPIALFDKSFVEMLNIDEAAIFDCLYSSIICPIFYTEVLADLSKEPPGQRSAERIVGDVAKKTPIMHATPNMLHTAICMAELAGNAVEMRNVPVRSGGKPVRRPDGTVGVIYNQAPEAKAFDRWQRGQFREIERDFAFGWRKQLLEADDGLTAKLTRQILAITQEPKNLAEALAIAKQVLQGDGQRFWLLRTAYLLLGLNPRNFQRVQARWVAAGRPPLHDFAPYTAHCLLVEVFFNVAIGKKLISPDRASNRVDMAYLFYLPFSMIFISNDKLHQRAAPLFMTDKQIFVDGDDLKKISRPSIPDIPCCQMKRRVKA
ncbi:hypothetical protein ACQ86E_00895 [Bradyrhizobium betae]|uniref:hypothetical protein n=1 Tax=Bradyrhizobium betae TaxID=244734 RepID=UPI003D668E00